MKIHGIPVQIKVVLNFSLLVTLSAARADEQLPVLKAGNDIYSNVTVTAVTATDVYFFNDLGMRNVKLKNLDSAWQQHFHYDAAKAAEVAGKQAAANTQYRLTAQSGASRFSSPVTGSSNPSAGDSAEARSTLTKVGDRSPVMSIQTIDNQGISFVGRVVVLDFFATWCGPCMEEMPYVENTLWSQLKNRGGLVIGVGREHSVAELQAFQKQRGYSFLFAADPRREIYGKFASDYIPRCVLIGRDGKIKYQTVGFSGADFAALVRAAQSELLKSN